jgi:hypothetical protein
MCVGGPKRTRLQLSWNLARTSARARRPLHAAGDLQPRLQRQRAPTKPTISSSTTAPAAPPTRPAPQVSDAASAAPGQPVAFAGVYDGHGGSAVASWLEANLYDGVKGAWDPAKPEASVAAAYIAADKQLLSSKGGFLGMGGRCRLAGAIPP